MAKDKIVVIKNGSLREIADNPPTVDAWGKAGWKKATKKETTKYYTDRGMDIEAVVPSNAAKTEKKQSKEPRIE